MTGKIKNGNPWIFMWIFVAMAELVIVLFNAIQGYFFWGYISWHLLLIGFVDAVVITSVILVFFVVFHRNMYDILEWGEPFSWEKNIRRFTREGMLKGKKMFRSFFEHAGDYVLVLKPSNELGLVIVDANEAALLKHGYVREELIGKPVSFLLHDKKTERERIGKIISGESYISEIVHRCKDGSTFLAEVSIKLIDTHDGPYFFSIERDISELKKVQEDKSRLEAQVYQNQKMETLGKVAGGIAHDFNNILTPIIGYTELSLDQVPETSLIHANLTEIYKASIRAMEFVKHIVSFSHMDKYGLTPLKIQPVMEEVLTSLRLSMPSDVEIHQDFDSRCGMVMADKLEIHQICMNLCKNACNAMSETGGTLYVKLEEVNIEPDEFSRRNLAPGSYSRLTVKDTGYGIDMHMLDKMFDPYFSVRRIDKGSGLGLSIVYSIVKGYKGEVEVYSEPGKGSEFIIYLPQIMPTSKIVQISPRVTAPSGSERILLVDDEEPIANLTKKILEQLGYKVTACLSSLDTLEMFRSKTDEFDLVITDQTMPDLTGIQLARKIKEIKISMPVIICTGFSEQISEENVKDIGLQGYIMKPLVKNELANMVRNVLDQRK